MNKSTGVVLHRITVPLQVLGVRKDRGCDYTVVYCSISTAFPAQCKDLVEGECKCDIDQALKAKHKSSPYGNSAGPF